MSARWGQKNSDARARLAQSAERKALNLVVVGSSPTVGGICPRTTKNGHTYENDGKFVSLYYRHMRTMTNSSQFNIHRYTLTMKNSSNVTHSCLLLLGSDPGSRVSNSSAMPLRYHRSIPTEALFVPALCHSSKNAVSLVVGWRTSVGRQSLQTWKNCMQRPA